MKAGNLSHPAWRAALAGICNPQQRFVLPGRASGGNLSLAETSI